MIDLNNNKSIQYYSKSDAESKGYNDACEVVLDGLVSPLDLYIATVRKIEYLTKFKEGLRGSAVEEFEQFGKKKTEYLNHEISIFEGGVKYDYSNCGDKELIELEQKAKLASEQLKERQLVLKSIKTELPTFNEDTGEVFKIKPPIKTSTTSLKIEKKKQ